MRVSGFIYSSSSLPNSLPFFLSHSFSPLSGRTQDVQPETLWRDLAHTAKGKMATEPPLCSWRILLFWICIPLKCHNLRGSLISPSRRCLDFTWDVLCIPIVPHRSSSYHNILPRKWSLDCAVRCRNLQTFGGWGSSWNPVQVVTSSCILTRVPIQTWLTIIGNMHHVSAPATTGLIAHSIHFFCLDSILQATFMRHKKDTMCF